MRPNNILIIGNYGAGNLGDDAIFAGIVSELKNIGYQGKISLLHGGFDSSEDIYKDFAKSPLVPSGIRSYFRSNKETFEVIKNADLVILGGGGLFIDSESIKAPYVWYRQAMACQKFDKPYICYSQSIGPLNSFISRHLTRKVFQNAKAIHFRDKESSAVFRDLKIDREVTISTDSALFWVSQQKRSPKEDIFLLCLRKWDEKSNESWKKIIEECENYAKENSLVLKLLPMDIRNVEEFAALKNTGLEVLQPKSTTDVVEMISKAKILCSMRLHASILALALGTPVLSISYSTKVKSFIETLNVKKGSVILNLSEIDKIQDSLKEISQETPHFDLLTPTKKNQEFLARELQL